MLQCVCEDLEAASLQSLSDLQRQVDVLGTHAEKYAKATSLFSRKNTPAFRDIKAKLAKAAPPGDACVYCERDRYRDIDHIRPKRHYPAQAFDWANYIYACVKCNQDEKKDTYAVFDAMGEIVQFDRRHPMGAAVPVGDHVLIDPRLEDPLVFLRLELTTGRFVEVGCDRAKARGRFTVKLFDLNNTTLARIRQQAYYSFVDYLTRYGSRLAANDTQGSQRLITEILELPHPTVLVEMRRQIGDFQELSNLFARVPASIGARKA